DVGPEPLLLRRGVDGGAARQGRADLVPGPPPSAPAATGTGVRPAAAATGRVRRRLVPVDLRQGRRSGEPAGSDVPGAGLRIPPRPMKSASVRAVDEPDEPEPNAPSEPGEP